MDEILNKTSKCHFIWYLIKYIQTCVQRPPLHINKHWLLLAGGRYSVVSIMLLIPLFRFGGVCLPRFYCTLVWSNLTERLDQEMRAKYTYWIGSFFEERKNGFFSETFFLCQQSVHVCLSVWICQVSIVLLHNFDLIHNLCNSNSSSNNCNTNNNHFKMLRCVYLRFRQA